MALKIQNLDELDPDLVAQTQAELTQLMQERHPEVELSRGVMHDLVAYTAGGISGGINQTEINRVLESRSLLAISENPELADPELADHVFSNFGVTRKEGQAATGEVTIIVDSDVSVVISAGASFTADGQSFLTDAAFTARPSTATTQSPNDRILQPLGDGTFSFSIPATAAETGEGGNIRRSTKLIPAAPPVNFVTAFAGTDFTGGSATELNADILKRMERGVSVPAWGNRLNIMSLLSAQATFADVLAYSIVGFGQAEMARDQHWIWPTGGGGKVDVYVRPSPLPGTVTLTKTATLVDITAAGTVWQFSLNRDDAPGFYEVDQIIRPDDPAENSGFEVLSDMRTVDLSALSAASTAQIPDITHAAEGVYSRFQTVVVRFLDTVTPSGSLEVNSARADYLVTLRVMPLIAELQDFCMAAATGNPAGDTLVKAAVPCFLTLNFDIQQAAGETNPDVAAIRQDLVTLVNNLGFPGQLNASLIANKVHTRLTQRQALGAIDMHGRIRRPDGGMTYVRASDVLRIPEDPTRLVSPRTTAFILDPLNVGISVVTEGFNTLV